MSDHTTEPQETPLKRCSKCKEFKPATPQYYVIDRSKKSGFISRCKECQSPPLHTVALPDGHKVCTGCNEMKPATREHFPPDPTGVNGLSSKCKKCRRDYEIGISDKLAQYRREYQRENRETLREKQRAYHAKPDKRDRRIERDEINRPKKRAQTNASARRRRQENPEAWRIRKRHEMHRRKALKLNAPGFHTPQDIDLQYEKQQGKCAYCQYAVGKDYHVDHVVALSRGGSNGPENLVIACPFCNMSKQDKTLYTEWIPLNPLPGIV